MHADRGQNYCDECGARLGHRRGCSMHQPLPRPVRLAGWILGLLVFVAAIVALVWLAVTVTS
jgi:hypothetical protein